MTDARHDEQDTVFAALRERFADVEQLQPSGYLADCPLHDPRDRRFVFFYEDGAIIGCSSGECSRERILSDAAQVTRERWRLALHLLEVDPDNDLVVAMLALLTVECAQRV